MEGGAGKDFESLRTSDGRENDANGSAKAVVIPSCCLKARASDPELDAKCHSTVVSGWFSELQSSSGTNTYLLCAVYLSSEMVVEF